MAAFERMSRGLPLARKQILMDIWCHPKGITCKELAAKMGVGMNQISGRFSELKKSKLITKIGVRDGSAIMIPTIHHHGT